MDDTVTLWAVGCGVTPPLYREDQARSPPEVDRVDRRPHPIPDGLLWLEMDPPLPLGRWMGAVGAGRRPRGAEGGGCFIFWIIFFNAPPLLPNNTNKAQYRCFNGECLHVGDLICLALGYTVS